MSYVNVIVREKNILELATDALKGDLIDLNNVLEVDTSLIEAAINMNKDTIYKTKLEEFSKIVEAEHEVKIQELIKEKEILTVQYQNQIKILEEQNKLKYVDEIARLNNLIENLKKEKKTAIENIEQQHVIAIQQNNESATEKYNELLSKYNILLSQLENQIQNTKLEIEKKYADEIHLLKEEKISKEKEFELLMTKYRALAEVEKVTALNEQKEAYQAELNKKDEMIAELQRQRASLNVKQTGEDLEQWCNFEVEQYLQNGLLNCTWNKDTKNVSTDIHTESTKADYIFNIYASQEHNVNELLAGVCLEMKDENPNSTTKQKNSKFYSKLNENRIKKGCKYAVLVSNLESDNPYIPPIMKIREYENMYLVRPAYLMVFLNLITSLTVKFADLVLAEAKEVIELKDKLSLIEEFESIKKTYLDNPLTLLSNKINDIQKQTKNLRDATEKIDSLCEDVKASYINKIIDKINSFELKSKKITKKLD